MTKENEKNAHERERESKKFVAHLNQGDGTVVGLTAEQFGEYVSKQYEGPMGFAFAQSFLQYHLDHAMGPVLAKLKDGLDTVSLEYVDHFEYLLNYCKVAANVLVNKDSLWTSVDKSLIARNEQLVAAGTPPFLQQVNRDWSSMYTNLYGLYDLPRAENKDEQNPLLGSLDWINGKAVFDVGGFIGDSLVLFKDLFPKSKLYAFEPVKRNYEKMVSLMPELVEQGRIIPVNKGLGDKNGKSRISLAQDTQDAAASIAIDYKSVGIYEDIEIMTLDSYVEEHNLEVGLIKADVEGFEPQVIEGALNTIKTQRPVLALATYHTAQEYYELKPYLESLNLGYKFQLRRSCLCAAPFTDVVLIAYPT